MARPQEINRAQILEKATGLLGECDIQEFSMRKLADQCNVAVSTIYLHFNNKLEIIITLASKFWEECFSTLDLSGDNDFFINLKTTYFHVLKHLEKFKSNWLNSFLHLSASEKSQGKQAMEKFVGYIRLKIETEMENNQNKFDSEFYRKVDKEFLSMFIYNNMMGLLMQYSHNYEPFEVILKRILIG